MLKESYVRMASLRQSLSPKYVANNNGAEKDVSCHKSKLSIKEGGIEQFPQPSNPQPCKPSSAFLWEQAQAVLQASYQEQLKKSKLWFDILAILKAEHVSNASEGNCPSIWFLFGDAAPRRISTATNSKSRRA